MGPADLEKLISGLNLYVDESTLVGVGDDGGVYLHRGNLYIHTVDFITPIVNDPYLWGAISAVNSLSDVYAMGGKPLNALAIVCFNNCDLDVSVLKEVLKGAVDKLREAKTVLLGGHTVDDKEPKFGLAVTGVCKDGKYLTQEGAKVGDILYLTKPIGVGILTKALKSDLIKEKDIQQAINYMLELNDIAGELALEFANACTDVTGFGLLGHAFNIARKSKVKLVIEYGKVPFYPTAVDFVQKKVYPKGAMDNYNFVKEGIDKGSEPLEWWQVLLLSDPVTSGGLLMSVSEDRAGELEKKAQEKEVSLWKIGSVEEGSGLLLLR